MIIQIIAMGHRMPTWVDQAYADYAKRLPPKTIQLTEIPLTKRTKSSSLDAIIKNEGEQMLSHIPQASLVIALDVKGKTWDTHQLASQFDIWRTENRTVNLLIGGPEGLATACLEKSTMKWSLSPLTLPHPLVRIIIIEQLYRAWTLLTGHPYHK